MESVNVTLATDFDNLNQEEKYETAKLTPEEAAKIIESLLQHLDYSKAKSWIASQKK